MSKREIKFRIWTTMYDEMLYLDKVKGHYDYELGLVLAFSEGGYAEFGAHERYDKEPEFIEMQYAELKDKNNHDIYEGDVLKIELPMGGFWGNVKLERIGVVRYEPDHGGYIVEWEYSKDQHHVQLNCDIAHTSEVLGDMYQNPELLNK